MSGTRNLNIIIIIIAVLIIAVGVPFINVVVNVPYTELETKQHSITSVSDQNVSRGDFVSWSADLLEGTVLYFVFSANDSLNAYIFMSTQYITFMELLPSEWTFERHIHNMSTGMIEYPVPQNGSYYFVLRALNRGSETVMINRCDIAVAWTEEVIKHQLETRKITLFERLTGDY